MAGDGGWRKAKRKDPEPGSVEPSPSGASRVRCEPRPSHPSPFVPTRPAPPMSRLVVTIPSSLPAQEHWRCGGHKSACKAYVLAATVQAQQERLCKAAVERTGA